MLLLSTFAVAALVLAAVGVLGVSSQAARARTREVGIRVALGAPRAALVRALGRRSAAFVGSGIVAGLAGAYLGAELLASELYRVDARDPVTLAAAAGLMATVALAATLWPTWRAARVDPLTAIGRD
jgi:ABC-type antimicrobial peptide transport system permease subunit